MLVLRTFTLASLLLAGLSHAAGDDAPPPPYVLEGTEVRTLHAVGLKRDYQLFIALPASYRQSTRQYPVLFVTDADYAFPLVRSIARRVGNHGRKLEEFILVGLSYAVGNTPEFSRRRDYTPTARGDADAVSDMPGVAPVFGQAEAYRQFIAGEVFPFIAGHYRADMNRKVFAGHSYGALLGTHMLFTDPAMFDRYILGSPSLWFDRGVMFAREREYAATHRDMKAKLFMATGSFEAVKPKSNDRPYNTDKDMVRDMKTFETALSAHHYPGLSIQSKVIDDEDHLTVAPAILTRGLVWAFGTGGQ